MLNGKVLKNFIMPKAEPYQFPQAEDLRAEFQDELFVDRSAEEIKEAYGQSDDPLIGDVESEEPSPNEASEASLRFAAIQADAILKAAQAEAEEIKASAAAQAAEELERIREGARQEGHREGYAQGMASAAQELQEQKEKTAAAMERQVQVFLENVALAQDDIIDRTQNDMRDLAIAVAEKVIRISLKSSSGIIARMIQDATEKLKRREWVHIYVAGCDAKGLAQITPRLTRALAAVSDHIKIVPMAEEESGTCIIETPDTIIDASASTQMSNITSMLNDMSPDDLSQNYGRRFTDR